MNPVLEIKEDIHENIWHEKYQYIMPYSSDKIKLYK
jgi:hypothetical protein